MWLCPRGQIVIIKKNSAESEERSVLALGLPCCVRGLEELIFFKVLYYTYIRIVSVPCQAVGYIQKTINVI